MTVTFLQISGIFYFSDVFLTFVTFMSYLMSLIGYAFLMSTLFNTSTRAVLATQFVFFFTSLLDNFLSKHVIPKVSNFFNMFLVRVVKLSVIGTRTP